VNSQVRSLSIAFLFCLSAISFIGCRNSDSKALPAAGKQASVEAAAQPDAPDAIKALQESKAELQSSAGGSVNQVTFRETALTDQLAASLAGLPQLQNLIVAKSEMTLAGWQQLAKLKQLKQLDLRDCALGNEELAAALSGMSELQVLKMSGKSGATTVDDAGMTGLKACPKLKVLVADFLWISEAGLAELSGLKDLRELYLANSLVDDAALARIGAMSSMKKLRIAKTGIGREGLDHLAALKLEELDVSECINIDDAALEPIGKIVTLKKLNLWRDAIGDAGVAHLASLSKLEWLNVDNTQLTDDGLKAFAGFGKLSFLHLGSTAVTDAGMTELTKLKSLKELKVTRTSVTEAGVEPMRKALPGIDIQLKYGEDE
jgi:hypothetical protein